MLLQKQIVKSRQEATGLILSGKVFLKTKVIDKPGTRISEKSEILVKDKKKIWVSRGGFKLDKAIRHFNISCKNQIIMDIGSSTGGFIDVLLANEVEKVYIIDVGYGQLAWKIRNNKKVIIFEKTNARYLDKTSINEYIDAIVCDVSFISLKKVITPNIKFLKNKCWIIALIKPQFEIGKELLGKGGIVRDSKHHKMIIEDINDYFETKIGFKVVGIIESPILGPKGNKEFLIYAKK